MNKTVKINGTEKDSNFYLTAVFKLNKRADDATHMLNNSTHLDSRVKICPGVERNIKIEDIEHDTVILYARYCTDNGEPLVDKCQDIVYTKMCQDIVNSLYGIRMLILIPYVFFRIIYNQIHPLEIDYGRV